ncbi:iron uptake transporter deferrochelatase/peroxidase subunit [Schinkia azotoformans]|uniref:Deferrochelatase n=1 Tax=Schinkia azotoformans LMG 9581 TaxID=1131731 RepID=K6CWM2_SCHAZ|nr:iron uptake transporter deferrochelatase/peroxidase subunit [Schinkia azotoformans]EKN64627.1 hypothetical protein BAZO_12779 [Schinkia azotoformans LMG 9581]MEC1640061.1 iron uptake transporter deferrochelatase/peroxidase subunit [Schinkia azotoformans]MEC1722622.1 iron uptake transporter deferrochelatase/peroxidase subunit [Schinkia azotoformans]MEC1943499.1 iron uptake transporter deferrochelatase/peroxidase subunit [Schinkia azotoformans]MED4354841.1 iron uptake transporter deferrochela
MADYQSDKQTKREGNAISRRNLLKLAGVGGLGVIIGATGAGSVLNLVEGEAKKMDASPSLGNDIVPFYGKHQAGIATEAQNHVYFASLEVTASSLDDLKSLFQEWTVAASLMTQGQPVGEALTNGYVPPKDTGEAEGLSAANLTITFGVGPSLFVKDGKDRFGLKSKQPKELVDLPPFPLDALKEEWTGGDICIQACADDPQVAFHAARNLLRIARGKAILHWAQAGFQRTKQADANKETPRNLFGFKDGTANINVVDDKEMNKHVWVQGEDGPAWLTNGTYLIVRKIQMYIEVWDRTTLREQENTFGRHRASGAPLGQEKEHEKMDLARKNEQGDYVIPEDSHARIAFGDGKQKILRRPYSYADGMDPKTGSLDAGLLFLSFQQSPSTSFIPMQERLSRIDKLNEYTVHRGSAIFAIFPGIKKGEYIGQTLFG